MEEKKFDFTSFIGMLLLGGIMLWWMNTKKPEAETPETTNNTEQVSNTSTATEINLPEGVVVNDSIKEVALRDKLGSFAHSAIYGKEGETVIENSLLQLTINNKGGQITKALLKNFKTHDSLPLHLIKDNSASFNINFGTLDNRILNTKDLLFTPVLTKNGANTILSMKLKVSEAQFLEYRYEIKEEEYLIDFSIRSQGLGTVFNGNNPITLDWELKAFSNEKALSYENQNTSIHYLEDGDMECLGLSDNDEIAEDPTWISYKQHFFSSILINKDGFKKPQLKQVSYVEDDKSASGFLKGFSTKIPMTLVGGEINQNLSWFYGPNDYNLLKKYDDLQLEENMNLGWGIFGALNRYVFYPVFNMLKGFIGNYGLIIIFMTIVVRLIMSPVLYKSYLSSAKMKVIRPEMEAINKKLPGKENAMKRQQEVMAIQRKAGVSMMSGCIPALMQMPVFFALFKFFPKEFDLRQKGFLWAEDLSAYDEVYKLPFNIPFYGDHISLFPILASIAIFFYMKMNQSQQANMQAPTQEGMPDMGKMMKYMIYFSPIMMLFFFNNYASGLSLYYFISNLLTIAIMLVIKNFVIDEKKIHAQIEENKKKPEKKQSKFRERINAAMKQAQEQQELQKKSKKK